MSSTNAIDDYTTNGNAISMRECLLASASVVEDKLIEEVTISSFFSIMVDESTDKTLESHSIIYVSYLKNDGTSQFKIKFLNFIGIPNGTKVLIFEA